MTVYYTNLLLILALAWPLCIYKPSKVKKLVYLLITFGFMWFFVTFRKDIGYDYPDYINMFETIKGTGGGLRGLWELNYDFGYALLTKGMSLFVTNYVMMYGIYELLVLAPVVWFIYKYCRDAWLSAWLFVTLTFLYTSMSFVRQSLACSLVLLAYPLAVKGIPSLYRIPRLVGDVFRRRSAKVSSLVPVLREFLPFLGAVAIILVAATFHKTSLVAIPFFFLAHFRLSKRWGIFYGSATLVLFLTSELILDFVTRFVYQDYRGTVYINPENGFPILFLIVPFVLFGTGLALLPVWRKREPKADFYLILMMFSAIIWLFITRHFVLERLSMYVYIFSLAGVPSALASLLPSDEDKQRLREMDEALGKVKNPTKEQLHKQRTLRQKISDHKKYYWSAVAAVLALTVVYHEYGAYVNGENGFHNVFPYQSVLGWLDRLG